jgi:hypothetical protein
VIFYGVGEIQKYAKWVESGYLDYGKITVFNNGAPGTQQAFTSVVMLEPEIVGGIYTKSNNKFNPQNYDWSWNGAILGVTVDEDKMSGTHALPNGNIIISETSLGRVSEITKSGALLWSYRNPTGGIVAGNTTVYPQFSDPSPNNTFFRAEKYPANYSGFAGHDLTATTGILENQNSVSTVCTAALGDSHHQAEGVFVLNPVKDNLIQFSKNITADAILIFDANGRLVSSQNAFNGNSMETALSPAVYFMQIRQGSFSKKIKIIITP